MKMTWRYQPGTSLILTDFQASINRCGDPSRCGIMVPWGKLDPEEPTTLFGQLYKHPCTWQHSFLVTQDSPFTDTRLTFLKHVLGRYEALWVTFCLWRPKSTLNRQIVTQRQMHSWICSERTGKSWRDGPITGDGKIGGKKRPLKKY